PVEPGDSVSAPAGVPHAIGEGVFLVELQEPSDLSVLFEWSGFALDGAREGHLGLGFDLALDCVVRTRLAEDDLAALRRGAGDEALLPPEADPYFRAARLGAGPLDAEFSIVVVLAGAGTL